MYKMTRFFLGSFLILVCSSAIENFIFAPGTYGSTPRSIYTQIWTLVGPGALAVFCGFSGVYYLAENAHERLDRIRERSLFSYFIYGAAFPIVWAGALHLTQYLFYITRMFFVVQIVVGLCFLAAIFLVPAIFVHFKVSRLERKATLGHESENG